MPDHRAAPTGATSPTCSATATAEIALLDRLRAGDEAAFRQLVTDLSPMLHRLARGYAPTEAAVQDAVQDTWLVVVDKLDSFRGQSTLRTWVCGILIHTARRVGVKESRTLPFSSAWADNRASAVDPARFHGRTDSGSVGTWMSPPVRWDQAPEEQLASKELREVIEAAIAALPARQRDVITARDVLGMEGSEAAAVLRVSQGNQRVLLHRARSKVRTAVEDYCTGRLGPRWTAPGDEREGLVS